MRVAYLHHEVNELLSQSRHPDHWSCLNRVLPVPKVHLPDVFWVWQLTAVSSTDTVQGGLDPNKISDLGADFGIIVRWLHGANKSGARKPSLILSWIIWQNNPPGLFVRFIYSFSRPPKGEINANTTGGTRKRKGRLDTATTPPAEAKFRSFYIKYLGDFT